jgi:hypothetical protein
MKYLYCYWCGLEYDLSEAKVGIICECKGGYLFLIDIDLPLETDKVIDIEEVVKDENRDTTLEEILSWL